MRRCFLLAATALAVACGQSTSDGSVATSSQALIASQCSFFAQNGKTKICHYTGAAKKPYNLISADIATCDDHAANHPNDFVSTTGDCSSPGCLPDLAPFDESSSVFYQGPVLTFRQPCCSGYVAFGVCQPATQLDKCTYVHADGTFTHRQCPPVSDVLAPPGRSAAVRNRAPAPPRRLPARSPPATSPPSCRRPARGTSGGPAGAAGCP